jgi:hypothetical protein
MSKNYIVTIDKGQHTNSRSKAVNAFQKLAEVKKFIGQLRGLKAPDYRTETYLKNAKDMAESTKRGYRSQLTNIETSYVILKHRKSGVYVSGMFQSRLELTSVLKQLKTDIQRAIRDKRIDRRVMNERDTARYLPSGERVVVTRCGNMIVPGELQRIKNERQSKIVFLNKSPRTNERHIGIELEFIAPKSKTELGVMLVQAELGNYVTLKGDGSIRVDKSGYNAHELTACIPESQRKVVISKIAAVLKECGALINKSCGFHVHLDMRSRDRVKAFGNLVSAQNVFYAMNPKSRKESTYCKKTMSKDLDKERSGSRYKGVNAAAINKYGTLEIRIHSGTVDEVKINNWVDLLISVTDADAPFKRAPRTIDSFCKGYNIPAELRAYIIERIRKFNNGAEITEVSEVG